MTALNVQLEVPPDLLSVLINPSLTIRELAKKVENKANSIVEQMGFTAVPDSVEEQCGLFLENAAMMQPGQIHQWIEHQSGEILEPFTDEFDEYLYSIRWHVARLDQESWANWNEAIQQVNSGLKMASKERLSEALAELRSEADSDDEDGVEDGGPIDESIRGLVPFTNPMTGETRPTLFTMPWVTKDIENT